MRFKIKESYDNLGVFVSSWLNTNKICKEMR